MKAFIIKYWALIALVAGFIVENATDIIAETFPNPLVQKLVYGLVVLIYGFFFTSSYNKAKVLEQYK